MRNAEHSYTIASTRPLRSVRGLTLVELLFSMGILAFTICGLLVSYTSAMVLNSTSKNVNIATNAAAGLLEQMRTDSFSRIINDYDGLVFSVNAIPSSTGVVYVDNTNPELLQVTISICWRQGNRVIGEDANLNGVLDGGEDANGNGIIDSPVQLVTQIANR
jgi:type II secretory pathway pseudopilin PulG